MPKFVGAYLKKTSATGYLRDGVNPNVRRQDTAREALLCSDCEQVISGYERQFSLSAFQQLQDDGFRQLEYGDWLLKFAVSLSWRTLVSDKVDLLRDFPQFSDVVSRTLENWRLFLFGERNQPNSQHHLFVMAGIPERVPRGLHPKFLHYVIRGIDATEIVGDRFLAVYVKVIRSMFFSPIIPESPAGWKNTRIHAGRARLISPQAVSMRGFFDFLNSRVAEVHAKPLSEEQSRKITEAALKNPERFANSESLKVELASRRLLGDDPPCEE